MKLVQNLSGKLHGKRKKKWFWFLHFYFSILKLIFNVITSNKLLKERMENYNRI